MEEADPQAQSSQGPLRPRHPGRLRPTGLKRTPAAVRTWLRRGIIAGGVLFFLGVLVLVTTNVIVTRAAHGLTFDDAALGRDRVRRGRDQR
jgi:hypothetical protein